MHEIGGVRIGQTTLGRDYTELGHSEGQRGGTGFIAAQPCGRNG